MLILVNKGSNSGSGAGKWDIVEKKFQEIGLSYDARYPTSEQECLDVLNKELSGGQKNIIAAGGDGTVNLILNALIDEKTDKVDPGINFGAIGLGSSNDFHKPLNHQTLTQQLLFLHFQLYF